MPNPRDIDRRVRQTRNDVDSLFELLREATETVSAIARTQQQHGARIERIEQVLSLHGDTMSRIVSRLERLHATQLGHTEIMDSHTEILDSHTEKLNEILALLREGHTR